MAGVWYLENDNGWRGPRYRELTRSDIDKIIERYKANEYLSAIARDYEVTRKDLGSLIRMLARDEPNWPDVARTRTARKRTEKKRNNAAPRKWGTLEIT